MRVAKKAYTMSEAAAAQRRAAAQAGAAKHPGGSWRTVRLRASVIDEIDARRGERSRAEHLARIVGGKR